VFVGEQPGDVEDRQGTPFVGPAGRLLDDVLDRVGIDRSLVYVTNAVKHFKFEQRGTRRIHQTPNARDVSTCLPWLEAELKLTRPGIIVALGATAARALFGAGFRVTYSRGKIFPTDWAANCMATFHPSMLLRVPEPDLRAQNEALFESDLRQIARLMSDAA
jgi:DNA polymerase